MEIYHLCFWFKFGIASCLAGFLVARKDKLYLKVRNIPSGLHFLVGHFKWWWHKYLNISPSMHILFSSPCKQWNWHSDSWLYPYLGIGPLFLDSLSSWTFSTALPFNMYSISPLCGLLGHQVCCSTFLAPFSWLGKVRSESFCMIKIWHGMLSLVSPICPSALYLALFLSILFI